MFHYLEVSLSAQYPHPHKIFVKFIEFNWLVNIFLMVPLESSNTVSMHLFVLLCSLILVKTMLGVILLRTAWKYHDRMKDEEKHEGETSKHTSGFTMNYSHLRKRQGTTSDSDVDTKLDQDKDERSLKSKSLSDIERFTLCSNRII